MMLSLLYAILIATYIVSMCNGQYSPYCTSDGEDGVLCDDYCGAGTIFGWRLVRSAARIICSVGCGSGSIVSPWDCTDLFRDINTPPSPDFICPTYCQYSFQCIASNNPEYDLCRWNAPTPLILQNSDQTFTVGSDSLLVAACQVGQQLSPSTCLCALFVNPEEGSNIYNSECNYCYYDSINEFGFTIQYDCSNRFTGDCSILTSNGCVGNDPTLQAQDPETQPFPLVEIPPSFSVIDAPMSPVNPPAPSPSIGQQAVAPSTSVQQQSTSGGGSKTSLEYNNHHLVAVSVMVVFLLM